MKKTHYQQSHLGERSDVVDHASDDAVKDVLQLVVLQLWREPQVEGPQLLRGEDVVAEQSAEEAEPIGILGKGWHHNQ